MAASIDDDRPVSRRAALAAALILVGALAGCGRKAPLRAPEGTEEDDDVYPRQYPA